MTTATIICDTRQKPEKTDYITKQLESLGYAVVRSKLLVGDYAWALDQRIVVDTKYGMGEIENNLIHDHERFRNECLLAQQVGAKLYVLVQDEKIKSVDDVFGWYNIRKKWSPKAATGRQLAKMMLSMTAKYGVEWRFCKKADCGKTIVELLGGGTAEV